MKTRSLALALVLLAAAPALAAEPTPEEEATELATSISRFFASFGDAIRRSDGNRVIAAPRASMKSGDGHVLPTRLIVRNVSRGTTTEVTLNSLAINPAIDDRIFSVRTLDQERDLPEAGS